MYYEGLKLPKTGKKYPARRMESILHNVFYTGDFMWDGMLINGTHEPIISKDLFYKVQDMFAAHDKTKKHNEQFAYKGLIKCALCGGYLTTQYKKGKSKKGNYFYYNCTNKDGVHKNLKHYEERYFDNTFANMLATIHLTDEEVEHIRVLTKNYFKNYIAQATQSTADLRNRIDILDARIRKSYEDKIDGNLPMSTEEFNAMCKEWQIERDKLSVKLDNIYFVNKEVYKRVDVVLMFSNELPSLFLKATKEEKNLIIKCMTNSITFDGETLNIELKDTFRALQRVKNETIFDPKFEQNRTPSNPVIATKKDAFATSFVNGASNGIRTHAYRNHNPRS